MRDCLPAQSTHTRTALALGQSSPTCPSSPAWLLTECCQRTGVATARGAGATDGLNHAGRHFITLHQCWTAGADAPTTAYDSKDPGAPHIRCQAQYHHSCDLQSR